MGASGFLSGLFLCLAACLVEPYNTWDFSRNTLAWRHAPQNALPVRQPSGPAFSSASSWSVVDASQPRVLSNWNPVTVQCGEAQVMVMVNRDLFGTGRLVQASDLFLGSLGCQYKSLNAEGNVVIFEAGLHECGSTLQMTTDSLVYSISLYYSPNPGSSTVIIRTSPAEVPIECHYPRKDNVSSHAIQPTWVPFTSTISAEERLIFSLRLMNEDWRTERTSNRYQLGDPVHIQADVNTVNHAALRLFIDNCVATLSPERGSSPIYTIIDFHGCLVDGQLDDSSSAFVSPRLKADSLQFTVDAFRFAGDARDLIYITCHLRVTADAHPLDHLNKACSFDKRTNSWIPVEGSADVCSCCAAQNCELPGHPLGNIGPRWLRPQGRFQRDASAMHGGSLKEGAEADVLIGPLILGAPKPSLYLPEDRTPGIMLEGSHKISMFTIMGLIVAASFIILALAVLGFLLACKKIRHSVV